MTSPDPVPLPPLPLAAIVTTEGMTLVATEVTAQALTVVAPVEPDVGLDPDELVAAPVHPPTTPPTTSATPAAAHGSHRRELRTGLDSAIPAPQVPSPHGMPRRYQAAKNSVQTMVSAMKNGSSAITVPIPDRLSSRDANITISGKYAMIGGDDVHRGVGYPVGGEHRGRAGRSGMAGS